MKHVAALLFVLCLFTLPQRAFGDIISYDVSQEASGHLQFPLFDSTLGTLDLVRIDLSNDYLLNVVLVGLTSGPHALQIMAGYDLTDESGGASLSAWSTETIVFTVTADGASSRTFLELLPTAPLFVNEFNNPEFFPRFSGNGVYTVLPAVTWIWQLDGGAQSAGPVRGATTTAQITYDYTPAQPRASVPEPSALMLLGTGFLVLGTSRLTRVKP